MIPIKYLPQKLKDFTGTRKQSFGISFIDADYYTLPDGEGEWSGGSRSQYCAIDLNTSLLVSFQDRKVRMVGVCVVVTGIFMGKIASPRFILRKEDVDLFCGHKRQENVPACPAMADWLLEQGREEEAEQMMAILGLAPKNEIRGKTILKDGKYQFLAEDGTLYKVSQSKAIYYRSGAMAVLEKRKDGIWANIKGY